MPSVNLPDFDDLITLSKEIGNLKKQIALDENALEILEAEITEETSTNEAYFVNGKPPSMSYTQANYLKIGYDERTRNELKRLKDNIAKNTGKLKEKEMLFGIYRNMIDIWRTESANERHSAI